MIKMTKNLFGDVCKYAVAVRQGPCEFCCVLFRSDAQRLCVELSWRSYPFGGNRGYGYPVCMDDNFTEGMPEFLAAFDAFAESEVLREAVKPTTASSRKRSSL
jgi:hypothetical protein